MSIDDQDDIAEIEVSTSEEIQETDSKEPPPDTLRIIEAILFASEEILPASRLKTILPDNPDARQIRKMVDRINEILQKERHPFEIVEIGGGYQFRTVSYYHPWVRQIFKEKAAKKLSIQSLECLAIIAYKQPLSKAEIEAIRGVVSDGAMKTLLEKRLVTITGRSDKPGRPLQYGTTTDFLKYFGLNKIEDLPRLEEFEAIAREKINELSIDELQTESQTTPADEESGVDGNLQHQESAESVDQGAAAEKGSEDDNGANSPADNALDTIDEAQPADDTTYKNETVTINATETRSEDPEVFEKSEEHSENAASVPETAHAKKAKVMYTDGFEIQDDITDEELTETTLQLRESSSDGGTRLSNKPVESGDEALFDQKTEIIFTGDEKDNTAGAKIDTSDDEDDFEVTIPPTEK
ncbi:MAG TPA: SMC-Scp complex subunit ScpB [Chitinispirillaceae bacterium]|nr:SMC-Scp complex subunit ScpB [Chitinispirillaceae bacterium]